ncbi:MAG: hypothetical protein H6546_03810 [Chitinophagales bacterium]|nr:hypothetical protein [Saprospiraceae bacterium]MCB9019434.1 hypothetical protein [Chitinophagales bacterium]MCB9312580.1 hypothetical protein [Lewinellaceae bacterium]
MKQILFVLLCWFGLQPAFGQARLGSSAQDIRSEFSSPEYELESEYTENGAYVIKLTIGRYSVAHLFNNDRICVATLVFPESQGALNALVEQYNDQYVIVSPTEWKMYSKGGIANVRLIIEEDGYYFAWTSGD